MGEGDFQGGVSAKHKEIGVGQFPTVWLSFDLELLAWSILDGRAGRWGTNWPMVSGSSRPRRAMC